MRDGLVALLAGQSSIQTLAGSRIYFGNAPQKATYPHIVITQMAANGFNNFGGTDSLRAVEYDIDCKADRAVESDALGQAVRSFIRDYTGTAGEQYISAVLLNSESSDVEPSRDGSDAHVHTTLIDVTIQYKPA